MLPCRVRRGAANAQSIRPGHQAPDRRRLHGLHPGEPAGHRPRSGAAPRHLRYARLPATAARRGGSGRTMNDIAARRSMTDATGRLNLSCCGGPSPPWLLSNSARGLWLGEALLQPRNLFRGPVANIGYLDPRVDIVRRGVDMTVADRCCRRHELVRHQLKKRYNRVPSQLRRYVRAARRQHPVRFAIEAAIFEKGHRVARILEVDDPHRSPWGIRSRVRAGGLAVLVHEPHERSVAKPRKPGG